MLTTMKSRNLSKHAIQALSETLLPRFSHDTFFLRLGANPPLHEATRLHALLIVHGHLHPETYSTVLAPKLVSIYTTHNRLQEALLLFDHLPKRNAFAWNSIIKGLVDAGRFRDAIESYQKMVAEGQIPDNFTYPPLLMACSRLSDLEHGRMVYADAVRMSMKPPNIFVQCALIDMFAKCGSLGDARKVFDEMPTRDAVSWGAMICGTMRYGEWYEALGLFRRMRWEGFALDSVVVATVLPACGRVGDVSTGMGLQCCAVKCGFVDDLFVSNALIDMYCKCGCTRIAHRIFGFMEHRDVVTWSSLIAGYSQNCEYEESLNLYVEMMRSSGLTPSSVTIASVIPSLAELSLLRQGKEVHGYAVRHRFELDKFVVSALVDFYSQCGLMRAAEFIFQFMSDVDIAVVNSMIAGYAVNGHLDSAFETLRKIRKAGLKPNSVTLVTVLPLCSRFTMLSQGKELHSYLIRYELESVVSVNNSVIDMYCKCGHLELGKKVFERMKETDVVTYNTVIAAYGMHGHGDQAISFFEQMKGMVVKPDKLTFIALLSACSHAGLIENGLSFYKNMIEDYNILPDMEHYSCMVDLYSRSGLLEDACQFIKKMPVEPNIDVLGSLLGACRVHKRIDLAEIVGQWLLQKKTKDPGYHILLSNTYAATGKWAEAMNMRTMIKDQGLLKKPGNSWIQVGCCIHSFIARDRLHPDMDRVHGIMNILLPQMKDEGYTPNVLSLHNLLLEDDCIDID